MPFKRAEKSSRRTVKSTEQSSLGKRRTLKQKCRSSAKHSSKSVRRVSANNDGRVNQRRNRSTDKPTPAKKPRTIGDRSKSAGRTPSNRRVSISSESEEITYTVSKQNEKGRPKKAHFSHSYKNTQESKAADKSEKVCHEKRLNKSQDAIPECLPSTSRLRPKAPPDTVTLNRSGIKPQPSKSQPVPNRWKKSPASEKKNCSRGRPTRSSGNKRNTPSSSGTGNGKSKKILNPEKDKSIEKHGARKSLGFPDTAASTSSRKTQSKYTNLLCSHRDQDDDKTALGSTTAMCRSSRTVKADRPQAGEPPYCASPSSKSTSTVNSPRIGSNKKKTNGQSARAADIRDNSSSQSLIEEHSYCVAVQSETRGTSDNGDFPIDRHKDVTRRQSTTDKTRLPVEQATSKDVDGCGMRGNSVNTSGSTNNPQPKPYRAKGDNRTVSSRLPAPKCSKEKIEECLSMGSCSSAELPLTDDREISISTDVSKVPNMADHRDTRKRKRDFIDVLETDKAPSKKSRRKIDTVCEHTISVSSHADTFPASSSRKRPVIIPPERETRSGLTKSIGSRSTPDESVQMNSSNSSSTKKRENKLDCNEKHGTAQTAGRPKFKICVRKSSPRSCNGLAKEAADINVPSDVINKSKSSAHIRKLKMVSLMKHSTPGEQMLNKSSNSERKIPTHGCSTSFSSDTTSSDDIRNMTDTNRQVSINESNVRKATISTEVRVHSKTLPIEDENHIVQTDSVHGLTPLSASSEYSPVLECSSLSKSTWGIDFIPLGRTIETLLGETNSNSNTAAEGSTSSADSWTTTESSLVKERQDIFLTPALPSVTDLPVEASFQTSHIDGIQMKAEGSTQTSQVNLSQNAPKLVTQTTQTSSSDVANSTTQQAMTQTPSDSVNETKSCSSIVRYSDHFSLNSKQLTGGLTPKRSARLQDRNSGTPKKYDDFVILPLRKKASPKLKDSLTLPSVNDEVAEQPVVNKDPNSMYKKPGQSQINRSCDMADSNSSSSCRKLAAEKTSDANLQEPTRPSSYQCMQTISTSTVMPGIHLAIESSGIDLPPTHHSVVPINSSKDDGFKPKVILKPVQREMNFYAALALSPSKPHPSRRQPDSDLNGDNCDSKAVSMETLSSNSDTTMPDHQDVIGTCARVKTVSGTCRISTSSSGTRIGGRSNSGTATCGGDTSMSDTSNAGIRPITSCTDARGIVASDSNTSNTVTYCSGTVGSGTPSCNPLKLRFTRTSQGLAIASLLLSQRKETNESACASTEPSPLKNRSVEEATDRPSPSQSKKRKAKAKTKGLQKKKINFEDVMKNQTFSEHAFTLWKSEKELEFQRHHPEKSQSEVLDIERAFWRDLPNEDKKKYFVRVFSALTDENKHSPERFLTKFPHELLKANKDVLPEKEVERKDGLQIEVEKKVYKFQLLPIRKQHDILRHHFLWLQRTLTKDEYTPFVVCIKQKLKESKSHWRLLSKEETEQTTRDVMFREICLRKFELKRREAKEREEAALSFNRQFEEFVNQLVKGGEASFDPNTRCQLLRHVLMDVQELEKESRVAVNGDVIQSESFETLIQDIRSMESKLQGHGAGAGFSCGVEPAPNTSQHVETKDCGIWGELPLLSDENTFAEQLLQELKHDTLPPLDLSLVENYLQAEGQSMVVDCEQSEVDVQEVLTSLIEDAILSAENLTQGAPCCELNSPSCILSSLLLIEKLSNAKGRSSV